MAIQRLPLASSAAGLDAWVEYDDATLTITTFGITAGTIPATVTITDSTGKTVFSFALAAGHSRTKNAPPSFKWAVDADGGLSYPPGYTVTVEG